MKSIGELFVDGYGIMIFSADFLNEYVKKNHWKSKRILTFFNKNKDKYYQTIKDGILLPFNKISTYDYNIFIKENEDNDKFDSLIK